MECYVERIDPLTPQKSSIFKAANIIRTGGVVAYPTETFYGLGVDALNVVAIEKIYRIKKRDPSRPILVVIEKENHLRELVSDIPLGTKELMGKFWPGPLTIIFNASSKVPDILTGNTGTIGIRITSHPVARRLLQAVGVPITATSANISGQAAATSALGVLRTFGDKVDLILDGGDTKVMKGSTVVDITVDPPRIIREGVIPPEEIQKYLTSSGKG